MVLTTLTTTTLARGQKQIVEAKQCDEPSVCANRCVQIQCVQIGPLQCANNGTKVVLTVLAPATIAGNLNQPVEA